jgi:predicted naringenin-chalcone synthase
MTATSHILGIGTALPEGAIAQEQALALARTIAGRSTRVPAAASVTLPAAHDGANCAPSDAADPLTRLYRHTTVRQRASVLFIQANGHPSTQSFYQPATRHDPRGPTTAARLARYAADSPALARRAAEAALADARTTPADITHVIIVSCTGFAAPGLDIHVIRDLKLDPSTPRTHIGFMGCHGALNGLRVADALAGGPPAPREPRILLLALELCSLHYQYDPDPGQAIANALFADGAAAAIVGPTHVPQESQASASSPAGALSLSAFASRILPDSLEDMTWTIGDHGFEMTLSRRVPELLREHVRPWIDSFLAEQSLTLDDIRSYAIHPGGPRILSAVADALELPPSALAPSREILAAHGNMSSPTILFILDHLRRAAAPQPTLALAFGPGLVAEAMLIG